MVIGMEGSLRGHDILLDDVHVTKKLASGLEGEGDVGSYIIIAFLGRFKGETVERYHLTPVASATDSGIEDRK